MSQYTQPAPRPERPPKRERAAKKKARGLRQQSTHPAAVARRERLEQAQAESTERWGTICIVPGCARPGWHRHHAYKRQPHPHLREHWANLPPFCRAHHALADDPEHWMYAVARELVDLALAVDAGRRPWLTDGEIADVFARHRELAERPHTSPMGRTD